MLMLGLSFILVRKSIFENPVLFGLYLGCRNKRRQRGFGIDSAWFGFGGGGFFVNYMLRGLC